MFEWLRRFIRRYVRRKRNLKNASASRISPNLAPHKAKPNLAPFSPSFQHAGKIQPSLEETVREEWLPTPPKPRRRIRPRIRRRMQKSGAQATRQDIGKFMKHGRQSSYYRGTVKARVQPEEEEEHN